MFFKKRNTIKKIETGKEQKLSKIIIGIIFFISVTVLTPAQGYICAIGGGSENYNDWSDAPYSWIVEKAGSGKIIILSYADATNWLPNYFVSLGASEAYNLKIDSKAAADQQSVYDEIISARAIFIKGGDQWNYVRYWKGTKTEAAIRFVYQSGGVISGTSAGAAILGDVSFTAEKGTVYPKDALINPFTHLITLDDDFLDLTPGILFDTHFSERGRFGRLISMLYNFKFTNDRNLIGVGLDDRTAICIDKDGIGVVMGSGAVAVFNIDDRTVFGEYQAGNYYIENLKCDFLTTGWKYDFASKSIHEIPASAKPVDIDRITYYPVTNFFLTGDNRISSQLNSNLNDFISEHDIKNIVVITHSGYSSEASLIKNYLSSINVVCSYLFVTESNMNDISLIDTLINAEGIIIAGDSLDIISLLRNSDYLISEHLYSRINSEAVPLFFLSEMGMAAGQFFIDNPSGDNYAAYRGKLVIKEGLSLFDDLIFQPMIFENSSYYENRTSSVLWGMMRNRLRFGLYFDGSGSIIINAALKTIKCDSNFPFILVDASESTFVDSSTYRASSSVGPRQAAAINNIRFSLTNLSSLDYSLTERKFVTNTSSIEQENVPNSFYLYQSYPNPFNSSTKIKFLIPSPVNPLTRGAKGRLVTLKVYNVLGNEITTLINEHKSPGVYEVEFNAGNLSPRGSTLTSGIYFYRLQFESYSEVRKAILLK
jgi:cyanophycinase